MKRIYTMLLAGLALCAVSCQEKNLETEGPETGKTMTFTASLAETKTAIQGNKSVWVTGDKITINGVELTAVLPDGMTEAETATFTGVVAPNPKTPKYVATYGKFNANQKAVAGNYDPAVVELTAESDNHDLFFRNTTALLRLDIQGDDNGKEISSVSFVAGADVVTLTGSKLNGVYYMAVQPKKYPGFDIKINDSVVKKNISGSFIPSASNIYNVGAVKHSKIYYRGENAGTNWNPGLEMIDAGNGQYVLFNVKIDAGNKIKFFIPQYWEHDGIKEDVWFGFDHDEENGNMYLKNTGNDIENIALGVYNVYFKTAGCQWWEKRVAMVKVK